MITNIVLTQKEKMLLQDQKSHEEICIEKYTNYANIAKDPQLKQLLLSTAQSERQHLDTINQLLNGQLPEMSGQQSGGQQMSGGQSGGSQQMSGMQSGGSQQMGGGQSGSSQQMSGGQSGGSQQMSGGQSGSSQQMSGGQSGSSQQMGGMQSGGSSSMQMGSSMQMSSGQQSGGQSGSSNFQASDKDLCTDLLMTEKYVSGAYNIAIFEFKDPQVRDVLNHIQKEEQKHGEAIFKYMESKGLYQVQ